MAKLVTKETMVADARPNALRIASLAAEIKAHDIRVYDVRGLTLVADVFVVCSATSEPQFKAIHKHVKMEMKQINVSPANVEGYTSGGWMVMDYSDILFHIFRVEAREFYDLDGLWGDAPQLDLLP